MGVDDAARATFFYVLPQERLPSDEPAIRRNKVVFDRETFDDVLFDIQWQRKQVGPGRLELLWLRLAERDSPGRATADRRLNTLDARLSSEATPRAWDYDVEGAYQFGRASSATTATAPNARVSAGFVHATAGHTFAGPPKLRLGLFYDYASGDHPGGTFGRFDTLFGSRRDDLGPSGTYAALARENISAPGVRLEAKTGTRLELLADYRAVWLASRFDRFDRFDNVIDAAGRSGDFGGQQVEGRLRYWIVPGHLRLESNYAVLFKGGFLRNAPQALDRSDGRERLFEVNVQATF